MSETTLQIVQIVKLLSIAIFAGLYGFGGMKGKWKRRIVGPVFLTAATVGVSLWVQSFNYWLLSYALLLYGSLSMGYGADTLPEKIKRRSLAGLAYGVSALPLAIVSSSYLMLGLHITLCLLVSVVLGVWNQTQSTRAEETIIGFTIGFLPLMSMV